MDKQIPANSCKYNQDSLFFMSVKMKLASGSCYPLNVSDSKFHFQVVCFLYRCFDGLAAAFNSTLHSLTATYFTPYH